jgi:hypothetical protein
MLSPLLDAPMNSTYVASCVNLGKSAYSVHSCPVDIGSFFDIIDDGMQIKGQSEKLQLQL